MFRTDKHAQPKMLVWNLPLRLFHWLLAGAFALAWLTRDDQHLDIHVFAGYLFAALLVFRLVWGFAGGAHARFLDFAHSPRAALDYAKAALGRRSSRYLGHNPAGSWAVYLLLGLGLLVAATGLATLGGEEGFGPLAGWLDFAAGDLAHRIHEAAAWAMLGLVGLHLAGVAAESLLHRENLAGAMVTGRKRSDTGATSARPAAGIALAMVLAVVTGAGVYFQGYLRAGTEQPYLPFVGPALPDHPLWRQECGSCHLAFHPTLLPTRSWRRLMEGQANHFGEDLVLDAQTVATLTEFLVANAAESAQSEPAWKIHHTTPAQVTPVRITETPYWRRKHADLRASVWRGGGINGRSDCAACHLDADAGTFQDGAMRLPRPGPLQLTQTREVTP